MVMRWFAGVVSVVLFALSGYFLLDHYTSRNEPPPNTPAPATNLVMTPEDATAMARSGISGGADLARRVTDDGGPGALGPHVRTSPPQAGQRSGLHVQIPQVWVDTPVIAEGIVDGRMSLPDDLGTTGWLNTTAPLSADEGSTILAGHVSWGGVHGALYYLGLSEPGQIISTWDENDTRVDWVITSVKLYERTALPAQIFQPTGDERQLNVVTCGGELYRSPDGMWYYDSNIVVTAVPMADGNTELAGGQTS